MLYFKANDMLFEKKVSRLERFRKLRVLKANGVYFL